MSNVIKLDVGGVLYKTTKDTLTKYSDSMLASMFSGRHPLQPDENGYHFIDRDGKIFEYILKFLRDDNINLDDVPKNILKNIMDEAKYYCLDGLIKLLEKDNHMNAKLLQKVFFAHNIDVEEFEKKLKEVYTIDYFVKNIGYFTKNRIPSEFNGYYFSVNWYRNTMIDGYDFCKFVYTLKDYVHLYFIHNSNNGLFKPFKSIMVIADNINVIGHCYYTIGFYI